jgi:hypothetical protein
MATRRSWYKIPGPLQPLIERLADKYPTWTPKQIYDELGALNDEGEAKYPAVREHELPEIRTVQRIVKKSRPPDPSGAWMPTEWPGEDIPPVLEIIKYLRQRGDAIWPTLAEAKRILWVRRAAPTLPFGYAWNIIRRYVAHEATQQSVEYLSVYLAFKSWEGPEAEKEYFAAVPERERYVPDVRGTTSVGAVGAIQITGVKGPARSQQQVEKEK